MDRFSDDFLLKKWLSVEPYSIMWVVYTRELLKRGAISQIA